MHPALSVIFFTVVSGAGYGLFVMLFSLAFLDIIDISRSAAFTASVLSIVLISAGLLSSTFHLANPKNAWRSFSRFKTSWLSREAVFAVLFYPFALLFVLGIFLADEGMSPLRMGGFFWLMGLVGTLLAIVTVFSTGMIYGCLKTIRQWNSALTPANYILLGLMLGSVTLMAIMASVDGNVAGVSGITMLVVIGAALLKAIYFFWVRKVTGPTINTATGFNRSTVRLLDVGHTAGTFLTDEFSYQAAGQTLKLFRILVFVLGFALPLLFVLSQAAGEANGAAMIVAAVLAFVGIGLERWLFFAEARHVVNLYHGAAHT